MPHFPWCWKTGYAGYRSIPGMHKLQTLLPAASAWYPLLQFTRPLLPSQSLCVVIEAFQNESGEHCTCSLPEALGVKKAVGNRVVQGVHDWITVLAITPVITGCRLTLSCSSVSLAGLKRGCTLEKLELAPICCQLWHFSSAPSLACPARLTVVLRCICKGWPWPKLLNHAELASLEQAQRDAARASAEP
jgi:hypothetical protein